MNKIKKIKYEEVRDWIMANSTDTETMDELNRLTYIFTSKYKEQSKIGKNY